MKSVDSFLTVVSRIKRVEYNFSRDHIKLIKETLFEKLKAFVSKLKAGNLDDFGFDQNDEREERKEPPQAKRDKEEEKHSFKSKNFSEEGSKSDSQSLTKQLTT